MDKLDTPRPLRGLFRNNTIRHETVKFQIAHLLLKQGFDIYPECEFKSRNGKKGRADLVVIKDNLGYIIEVLASESEERYLSKQDYYPEEFTMVKVRVDDFDPETWCL